MGLMDFFIRPEPVSYGTVKGLNTLQINRIAADRSEEIFVPPGTRLINRWRNANYWKSREKRR